MDAFKIKDLPMQLILVVQPRFTASVVEGVDWVFVDHSSYHRPGTPYGDIQSAFGDNQFCKISGLVVNKTRPSIPIQAFWYGAGNFLLCLLLLNVSRCERMKCLKRLIIWLMIRFSNGEARGAYPCLLIQTKQQPSVLRAEAQGRNEGYGFQFIYWEWDPLKGHITNGTPAYEMWMMELLRELLSNNFGNGFGRVIFCFHRRLRKPLEGTMFVGKKHSFPIVAITRSYLASSCSFVASVRCDHETNQIERFSYRRAKLERRPQTKDGQASVPRVRVFPIMKSRSCVVGLVARQSTGWRLISARCTLWGEEGGDGPLDIVLSGSSHLVHSPLDGRCKGQSLGVVSTPYCRAAKLTLVY
ncbi:hypothetical protein M9H77_18956 [Catharanthus roseus]|uniref:Uncharacterized protein n=1 Tax=Catharanthus roseus TaxID=4058 RepID=A0ACC0B932_CATRO|nr:hypothetical protein M9H77_18956 [Catharanthus roseus]